MDMLERSVDEPKIAQTIMYKNQHLNSEDDIIQTITAIKFFIYLCVNGRFQNLNPHKTLPQEDAALFHLANGDSSLRRTGTGQSLVRGFQLRHHIRFARRAQPQPAGGGRL